MEFLITQDGLDAVRDLLVRDLWRASRSWNGPMATHGATPAGPATRNPIENLVVALSQNPIVPVDQDDIFTLREDRDPWELIGAAGDRDILRSGEPPELVIGTDEGKIKLTYPGFVTELGDLPEIERDLPPLSLPGMLLRAKNIRLRWGENGAHAWARNTVYLGRPAIEVALQFEAQDPEIVGAFAGSSDNADDFELDWVSVGLRVYLLPRVEAERLLWNCAVSLRLVPPADLNAAVRSAVETRLQAELQAWIPLITGVLTSLPLRPVLDNDFFRRLSTFAIGQLQTLLLTQMYDEPERQMLIESCLLPTQPARMFQATLPQLLDFFRGEGVARDFLFPARLTDHYCRHVAPPQLHFDQERPAAMRFQVEPIDGQAWHEAAYGQWFVQEAATDPAIEPGRVVLREQYLVTIDHLRLPGRAIPLVPTGPLQVRWDVRAHHERLGAANAWGRVGSGSAAVTQVNGVLPLGADGAASYWLDHAGDVEVAGVVSDGANDLAWFSNRLRLGRYVPGSLTVSLPEFDGSVAIPVWPPESTAHALVRLEQQTSLPTYALDWLLLKLVDLRLGPTGIRRIREVVGVPPFVAPLFAAIWVEDQQVALAHLDQDDVAALQDGSLVRFPRGHDEHNLYNQLVPALMDFMRFRVALATHAIGQGLEEVIAAEIEIARSRPEAPDLVWGIHPGLGRAGFDMGDHEQFAVQFDLYNEHFRSEEVKAADAPKPYKVRFETIDVCEPTEPFGANLAQLSFDARYTPMFDGRPAGRWRSRSFGPFNQPTPVLLPVGADSSKQVKVPVGGRLAITLVGRETAFLLPPQDLGQARLDFDVPAGDDIDGLSGWSQGNEVFRFRVRLETDAEPPPPDIIPKDAMVLPPPFELRVEAPDHTWTFRYGTAKWTDDLKLEARAEDEWEAVTILDPEGHTVTVDPGTASPVIYRLVATNSVGTSKSRRVRVTYGQ